MLPYILLISIAGAFLFFLITSIDNIEKRAIAKQKAEFENVIDIKFVDGTEMHGLKRVYLGRTDTLKTEDGKIIEIQNWKNVIWTKETPPQTNSVESK